MENSDSLSGIYSSNTNDSFLVGAFSASNGYSKRTKNDSTAICIFSLSQIEQLFSENIHRCFNGSMRYRNMEYISGAIHEGKCPDGGSTGNIADFCKVALKISGNSPIITKAYQVYPYSVTSVFFKELPSGRGVLLVGASGGKVKVVLISQTADTSIQNNTLTDYQLADRKSDVSKVYLLNNDVIALQSHTLTKLRASISRVDKIIPSSISLPSASVDYSSATASLSGRTITKHGK